MDGIVLLSLLLAQQIAGDPSGPLQIDASVALGGHVATADFTELRVSIAGSAAGTVHLETIGNSGPVKFKLELTRGAPATITIPLGIDFSRRPALKATFADEVSATQVPLNFIQHASPPRVLAGTLATDSLIQLENTVSVNSSALPRLAPTYRQMAALVIDGTTLATLDDDQLRALLDYAGTCGRLLLINVSSSVEKIFVSRAACDRAFLSVIQSTDNVEAAFTELAMRPAVAPPSKVQLARLLETPRGAALDPTVLGYFWTGYLLVLLLLMIRVQTRIAALGFSVVSTLLVLLIWPSVPGNAYVAWAETSSTGRVANYSGIERYVAARHGIFTMRADRFGTYPDRIDGDAYQLLWGIGRDERLVQWNASSFQHLDKLTRGSFAVEPTLRAAIIDAAPVICNTGSELSRQAFLQWHGKIFAVPPLPPGTTWSATSQQDLSPTPAMTPVLQLFLLRSRNRDSTLLQSLIISRGNNQERAWLLRYGPEQSEHAACAG